MRSKMIAIMTVACLGASAAQAAVVTIGPGVGGYDNQVKESWLRGYGDLSTRENHSTRDPNAAGAGAGAVYRMYALNAEASRQGGAAYLLRFDLSGAGVPQGATINSATLTLYYRNNSGTTNTGRKLAKLLPGRNWIEGASIFSGPAVSGEPTWNSRVSYPVGNANRIPWATAGGSYGDGDGAGTNPADHESASVISFDTTGNGFQQKTFDVTTWVQAWVTTPANNAGMVAWGGTDTPAGFNGFWSLVGRADTSSPNFRPSLVIDYSAGPPVAPIIAQPPNPDNATFGSEYVIQLTLVQGEPAPTWTLLQSPAGAVINSTGLVSGWIASTCEVGSLYTFEARAQNAQGTDTKSWQVSVQQPPPPSNSVVLEESLTNSTTAGVRLGGAFQADGWRVVNNMDAIYWHISPTIDHGRYEYDIKGISLDCVGCCYPDGSGTFLVNELSHMYDYTFENADTNYTGYRNNPYKHAYKRFSYALPNTVKMLWAINGDGGEDWAGSGLSWNPSTTYHLKAEWEPSVGGGSDYRAYRDGQIIHSTHIGQLYTPVGHSFRLASGGRTEEAAYIGAVYSNVKFWDLDIGQYVTPVIATVTPNPDTAWYGSGYSKQLTLQQGSPAPAWCLLQGPPGAQIGSSTGLVSGYSPVLADVGTQVLFEARAVNAGGSDTVSWNVLVKAKGDLDLDGDSDQIDFGSFQRCLSGAGILFAPGCDDADLDVDDDVDQTDFAKLLVCLRGANVAIDPDCAD